MIQPTPDRWLKRVPRGPRARVRLFCFPYAGGGASAYRLWGAGLPPWIEPVAVQLPGREERLVEPPYTAIAPLVQGALKAMGPFFDLPFALFGHSMGALVVFELARALRRLRCAEPAHLFVSGRCAPELPHPLPPLAGKLDADLMRQLARLGGTPPEVLASDELMELVLPIFRADVTVCEKYEYRPELPLGCAISAFGGLGDPVILRDTLLTWEKQTTRGFTLRMVPGGHLFVNEARDLLCGAISDDLARFAGPPSEARSA